MIVGGPDYKWVPTVTPDGSWITYLSRAGDALTAGTPVRLMRVSLQGGSPQELLKGRGVQRQACAWPPATLCVFSEESPDRKELVFWAFDPIKGEKHELTKVSLHNRSFNTTGHCPPTVLYWQSRSSTSTRVTSRSFPRPVATHMS